MADATELKDQGNKLFQAGEWLKAAAVYTQAIKLAPDNAVLYSNRSAALLKLKKVNKALEDADKCIQLRPDWEKGYYRKGSVLEDQDKLQEALEVYHAALKVCPEASAGELSQKIRTLTKFVQKKAHVEAKTKGPEPATATGGAGKATSKPESKAEPAIYEDMGSEAVAAFAEEYLGLLEGEVRDSGTDWIPMVHMLPGPNAKASDEVQPHIRGAGAWEAPEMLEGFMNFLRKGAEQLDAEAVLALVPKSAIGWPQTWTKPKWPGGDGPGVFAQLESRLVRKCWFIPVKDSKQLGTPVHVDPEDFGPLPGRILRT